MTPSFFFETKTIYHKINLCVVSLIINFFSVFFQESEVSFYFSGYNIFVYSFNLYECNLKKNTLMPVEIKNDRQKIHFYMVHVLIS